MKEPKYRHEFKYLITNAQLALLKARARAVMKPDSHTGDGGIYNIRSLYFDDCDNTCFYENENGTDPREKLRIRIYNHSPERITLECKRKERGKTLKTSCRLTKEQTQALMDGRIPQGEHPTLLAKLCVYMNVRRMRPAIKSGKRSMIREKTRPMHRKVRQATRKMRRACMGRFSAFASEIMRASAMGRPAVDSVRNTLYTL